jgi:Aldose 1-epimerase
MLTDIATVRGDEFQRVVLQNRALRAVILPELGGKITSLVNLKTGREFFLQHPDRPLRRARYGDPIGDYDISGFDECLPTVSQCLYPDPPFAGVTMPDHGEVWSCPWRYQIQREQLMLEVAGIRLPYLLRRTTRLTGSGLDLEYEITNTGSQPFKYLWSAHPLLTVQAGAQIVLPAEVSEVLVDYSAGNRFAIGKTIAWPHASTTGGKSVALNHIFGPQQRTADKLFTPRLTQGYCGLRFPATAEAIVFRFDPQLVPFVGIWICQGGFPSDGPPEFTVALEPCGGRPDSLATAIARGECPELLAHATHRWKLQIEIESEASIS